MRTVSRSGSSSTAATAAHRAASIDLDSGADVLVIAFPEAIVDFPLAVRPLESWPPPVAVSIPPVPLASGGRWRSTPLALTASFVAGAVLSMVGMISSIEARAVPFRTLASVAAARTPEAAPVRARQMIALVRTSPGPSAAPTASSADPFAPPFDTAAAMAALRLPFVKVRTHSARARTL